VKATLFVCTVLLLIFDVAISMADSIVLKDGTKLVGTVANAGLIESGRIYSSTISILVGEDLQRVPVTEIDYITIGEGADLVVVDPSQSSSTPPPPSQLSPATQRVPSMSDYDKRMKRLNEDRKAGIILTVVGVAAAVVGIAVPFGGEQLTVTSNNINYDETSMNALNYAMIIGGSAFAIGGITMYSKSSSKINALKKENPGFQVSWSF